MFLLSECNQPGDISHSDHRLHSDGQLGLVEVQDVVERDGDLVALLLVEERGGQGQPVGARSAH